MMALHDSAVTISVVYESTFSSPRLGGLLHNLVQLKQCVETAVLQFAIHTDGLKPIQCKKNKQTKKQLCQPSSSVVVKAKCCVF